MKHLIIATLVFIPSGCGVFRVVRVKDQDVAATGLANIKEAAQAQQLGADVTKTAPAIEDWAQTSIKALGYTTE